MQSKTSFFIDGIQGPNKCKRMKLTDNDHLQQRYECAGVVDICTTKIGLSPIPLIQQQFQGNTKVLLVTADKDLNTETVQQGISSTQGHQGVCRKVQIRGEDNRSNTSKNSSALASPMNALDDTLYSKVVPGPTLPHNKPLIPETGLQVTLVSFFISCMYIYIGTFCILLGQI